MSMPNSAMVRRIVLVVATLLLAACTGAGTGSDTTAAAEETTEPTEAPTTTQATTTTLAATTTMASEEADSHAAEADPADVVAATLATADFQDVSMAEAAGYASTMDALGCFENPEMGGMGLHYLNETLMDAEVDIATPEALVFELDADGNVAALVAHEYIVPVEAWSASEPPSLFGMDFHQHPVLPLWVLHVWLWKDNPAGMFQDWNPAVRLCPDGVPIFGVDLP